MEKDKKVDDVKATPDIMHDVTPAQTSLMTKQVLLLLVLVAVLGIGSGFVLANVSGKAGTVTGDQLANSGKVEKGKIYGSNDTKTFNDTAEGVLKKGGFEGEGQFHLQRSGGDSQSVYLSSSNVDLALFVDKKVKIWGATQTPQKVGWLMDAGRVQVLE